MSMEVTVRFYGNSPESEYASSLLSHCFNLFEELKDLLNIHNFLAVPFTINEEELYDQIEDNLGGEPEEEDGFDEFEKNMELELGQQGDFFPVVELIKSVSAYCKYFQSNSDQTFNLGYNRQVEGKVIGQDLDCLRVALAQKSNGKARLVIG